MRVLPAKAVPTKPRRFSLYLLSTSAIVIFLVCVFNLFVDPYRIFYSNSVSSMSERKARPNQFQQEIRSLIGQQVRADVLLFGNSTIEIGFDPVALLDLNIPGPVYNLAIGGFTLEGSTLGLRRVVDNHPPRFAIIGVSFTDYLNQGAVFGLTAVASESSWFFSDLYMKFVSLAGAEALFDSFRTLLIPHREFPQTLTAFGFNPMLEYHGHAKTSGYRVLFDTTNKKIYSSFAAGASKTVPQVGSSKSLRELLDLVKFLSDEGVEVLILIPPFHEEYYSAVARFGLTDAYQDWKTGVLKVSRDESLSSKAMVFDFSCGGNAINEKVPKLGDRLSAMEYYWDSVHFKSEIGSRVARLIFDRLNNSSHISDDVLLEDGVVVGRLLSPENLEEQHAYCHRFRASN
jgi:hypothetical protein